MTCYIILTYSPIDKIDNALSLSEMDYEFMISFTMQRNMMDVIGIKRTAW